MSTSVIHPATATSERSQVGIYPGSCTAQEALALRDLAGRVVLQGDDGLRVARSLVPIVGADGIQLDPATYRTEPSKIDNDGVLPGLEDVCVDWVREQRILGLNPVYTSAYRIRAGDTVSLARHLDQQVPRSTDEVRVVVALDSAWLTEKHYQNLTNRLAASGIRHFAIVLGDLFDPLGEARKVWHLRELIAWSKVSGITIDLLRTDMSGLRAVLSGARFGGIGLTTSTRHLGLPFPAKAREGFDRRKRSPLVFVPKLMHWVRANHLGALSAWSEHPLNECFCPPCLASSERSLARFDQANLSRDLREQLRAHDAWAITAVVAEVLAALEPSATLLELQNQAIELALSTTVETKVEITLPPWFEHWQ